MLIVGSGNVVHNLGGIDWELSRTAASTGRSGSTRTPSARCSTDPDDVTRLDATPRLRARRADARPLHPAALPRRPGRRGRTTATDVLVDGYAYGSLSMTAYTLGPRPARGHRQRRRDERAAALPDGVPTDGANI